MNSEMWCTSAMPMNLGIKKVYNDYDAQFIHSNSLIIMMYYERPQGINKSVLVYAIYVCTLLVNLLTFRYESWQKFASLHFRIVTWVETDIFPASNHTGTNCVKTLFHHVICFSIYFFRCCRHNLNSTCFPIEEHGRADRLPDGTPCYQGFCNMVRFRETCINHHASKEC